MTGWRKYQYIYITVLLAVAAGAAGYYWMQTADVIHYDTVAVERGNIEQTVSALGVLVPSQYVDVGAQVEGQLAKLLVEPGDKVDKGQLLALIDPTQYAAQVGEDQAQIADLEAQADAAKAKLALASWTNSATQTLVRTSAASQQAAHQSEADEEVAVATIASLKAQAEKTQNALKFDQAQLDRTKIYAPIAGVATYPTTSAYGTTWSKLDVAHPGQILNNKQTAPILFRVVNIDQMMVRAQVSEADVAKLITGMPVYFTTLGRPNDRIEAKLDAVEVTPELINGAIFYDADFEVPNPDGRLLPQMSVQVSFVLAQAKEALVAPVAALLSVQRQSGATVPPCSKNNLRQTSNKGGGKGGGAGSGKGAGVDCVLVLKNGKPETRQVTVGVRNEVSAQLVSGVAEGDQLILATAAQKTRGGGGGGGKHRGG